MPTEHFLMLLVYIKMEKHGVGFIVNWEKGERSRPQSTPNCIKYIFIRYKNIPKPNPYLVFK